MRVKIRFFVVIALMLSACAPSVQKSGDILVLGDSVMAWNGARGASIPHALENQLDRTVTSRAVVGAKFSNSSPIASAVGLDIQQQLLKGRWNWIVLDGGANDLGFHDCGCGACLHVVDQLIDKTGRAGAIPSFLTQLRSTGAQVIWLGYYHSPGAAFKGCRDDLVEMEQRIAHLAATIPTLHFVDGEDVINRNDPSHFARDNTHPSAKGSALLAKQIASVITSSQTTH